MKYALLIGTAIALATGVAHADTLDVVKSRGQLKCGVNTGLAGFAAPDQEGNWQGFDVSICRAVAAAVFGNRDAVEFVPVIGKSRFVTLASEDIDLLTNNTTWTYSRDVDLNFTFTSVTFYDGQAFLVPATSGINSVYELDGKSVCAHTNTTTELNLVEFFRANEMSYEPVPVETNTEALQQYAAGACDAYTSDASALAASRATFDNPDEHVVLPEIISKEPLGPVVRQGDDRWADLIRWTVFALISAEELGITAENVDSMAADSEVPEIRRLLGVDGNLGEMIGLSSEWARNAIAAEGNYGEIFADNVGVSTRLGIPRGMNALWTNDGLHYSPPFR